MHKAVFIFLFSGLLLVSNAPAQTTFQKMYHGASNALAWCTEQTSDGGYIICGTGNSAGPQGCSFMLIKTDAGGDTLWTRFFGGTGGEIALCVKQTADGGYIAAGGTYSFGAGGEDAYLVKTDSNGTLQWSKTYGGIYADELMSVESCPDGGYILLGSTASFSTGPSAFDVYLIRTDVWGDTLWTKTFGGSNSDEGLCLQLTSDGGYIIAGITKSFGSGQDDVYLIKTDTNGDLLWSKSAGGTEADVAWAVREVTSGGFIVAGTTHSSGINNTGDFYLLRTDPNGDTLWTKTYGGFYTEQAYSVRETADHGFAVLGETYSFGAGRSDLLVVKTDSSGNLLWSQTYGDSLYDHGYCIRETNDNGLVFAGSSNSFGAPGVYLIKTGSLGNSGCYEGNPALQLLSTVSQLTSPLTLTGTGAAVSNPATFVKSGMMTNGLCDNTGIAIAADENSFRIFPNPSIGDVMLEFDNAEKKNCTIRLYNAQGQLIRVTEKITTNSVQVKREDLAAGFYFFRLSSGEETRAAGKIIFR